MFNYVYVCVCVYMTMCMYPQRSREGIGVAQCGFWELNSDPPKEQCAFLATSLVLRNS